MEDLREARAKIERLEKALEYTATQRAHEYAVATGCTPAQAFDYVDQLEEEAKRRRLGLGKQAEME